jgi:hypothetical protein
VYPSSHYVTPRDKVLAAVETIKIELDQRLKELVGMGKLVEAQRLEQRTRFDLEMLSEVGHCKGIENYTRHLSAPRRASRPAPDRLPACGRDHVPGRKPPDDRAARRHVQRRPLAQDHAGRIRLSPAQRAGQPAAEVRGVRAAHAPVHLCVGHARRL